MNWPSLRRNLGAIAAMAALGGLFGVNYEVGPLEPPAPPGSIAAIDPTHPPDADAIPHPGDLTPRGWWDSLAAPLCK